MGLLNFFNAPKDVADTVISFVQAATLSLDFVDRFTPKLDDEVIVEVVGQPGSTKQQLYWLALTTAYGLARPRTISRLLAPPPGLLMVEYDASDNWVRCTLRYRLGVMQILTNPFAVPGVVGTIIDQIRNPGDIPVIYGPPDDVKGASPQLPFVFVGLPINLLPGVPLSGLPFSGRQVLSSSMKCPDPDPNVPVSQTPTEIWSPNPKPSGDNRSRGSVADPRRENIPALTVDNVNNYLIPMVFAALTDPGSQTLAAFMFPFPGPTGG